MESTEPTVNKNRKYILAALIVFSIISGILLLEGLLLGIFIVIEHAVKMKIKNLEDEYTNFKTNLNQEWDQLTETQQKFKNKIETILNIVFGIFIITIIAIPILLILPGTIIFAIIWRKMNKKTMVIKPIKETAAINSLQTENIISIHNLV